MKFALYANLASMYLMCISKEYLCKVCVHAFLWTPCDVKHIFLFVTS